MSSTKKQTELIAVNSDTWHSIVVSLGNRGGYIISNKKLCEINIFVKKLNQETRIMEKFFKKYEIYTQHLDELINDVGLYQYQMKVMEEERKKEKEEEEAKKKELLKSTQSVSTSGENKMEKWDR